ncbi:MAG: fused MFS/spermidine synthase [Fimbriimonas sp.]
MVFFQAALLLGYAYAHFSTKWLGARQRWVHLAVLAVAGLVALPFHLPNGLAARGAQDPTFALLGLLAIVVGPVFFAVSAGAPILQRWFSTSADPLARDPYFLYSASNVGSFVALLGYPFAMEPAMRLAEQSRTWMVLYGCLFVLMALCALVPAKVVEVAQTVQVPKISSPQRWRWIALAAVPTSLMLGVTSYMSTNIAPMPLLWVVPLALYLLSYILAFASRRVLSVKILTRAFSLIVTPLVLAMILESHEMWLSGLHLLAFFLASWMCHAQLAEDRPEAENLTEFFLWLSVGGVVGGIFNGLVAPVIFNNLYEYPIAIVAACCLRAPLTEKAKSFSWLDLLYPIAIGILSYSLIWFWKYQGLPWGANRTAVVAGIPAILSFLAVDRSWRFGLSLGSLLIISLVAATSNGGRVLSIERSFYGVHRVTTDGTFHRMVHGNTVHGMQFIEPDKQSTPLTYYFPNGPIGEVIKVLESDSRLNKVGFVGLGVGSLAGYGRPGMDITFYEIDPTVERMARNPNLFTYLSNSKGNVKVVLGDARLMLEDAADGGYGLIALDAFSSDAIPVHLLTKEAFELYGRKLRVNGLLAVHISNRYLNLAPVVAANARELGLWALEFTDGATDDERAEGKNASRWILVGRDKASQDLFRATRNWEEIEVSDKFQPWTDDFSNILKVWNTDQ